MARSVLGSFVSGTRQMLAIQLIISVSAVGLAGWTLGVTNDLIRERNRLNQRVIQLEETLVTNNIVVPSTVTVVDPPRPQQTTYPPSVTLPEQPPAPPEAPPERTPSEGQQPAPETPAPQPTPQPETPPAAEPPRFDPGVIIDLFRPPPALRTIVLHVRSEADRATAQSIATELTRAGNGVQVTVVVMPPRDPRQSGYAYFDGRQSRAAAAFMQQFHDAARRREVAPWSAQLRGVALPAQGEYTAERLDVVLPPLPTAPTGQRVDPRRFQEPPPVVQQGPIIR